MRHRLKLVVLDEDGSSRPRVLIKKSIYNEEEALESFREILQGCWGVPDDEIIKRFRKAIQ
jgi:hypothetical protein